MKLFRLAVLALLGTLLMACQSSMSQSSQSSASMPMPSSSSSHRAAPRVCLPRPVPQRPRVARGPQYRRPPAQDSNPSGQAAVAVSPVRRRRPAKAAEPLPVTAKVGKSSYCILPGAGSQDQDSQNDKNDGSSGETGVADSGSDRGNGTTSSSGSGDLARDNTAQGPGQAAGTSVRLPAGEPVAAVKQETPRLAPQMETQVGIQGLQTAL